MLRIIQSPTAQAKLMASVRQLSAAQNRTLSTDAVLRLLLTSYHGR